MKGKIRKRIILAILVCLLVGAALFRQTRIGEIEYPVYIVVFNNSFCGAVIEVAEDGTYKFWEGDLDYANSFEETEPPHTIMKNLPSTPLPRTAFFKFRLHLSTLPKTSSSMQSRGIVEDAAEGILLVNGEAYHSYFYIDNKFCGANAAMRSILPFTYLAGP